MNARWAIAWLFLAGFIVSALLEIPVHARLGMPQDVAWQYLRDVGVAYAGPLGIIVPAMYAARNPLGELTKQQSAFALVVATAWALVPIGVGVYAAWYPDPSDLGAMVQSFNTAAIPINGVLVAVLATLFPKPCDHADTSPSAAETKG
jgi:hypothetical protein